MTMQRIKATSPDAQSADLIANNIDKLNEMFPELVTEGPDGAALNVDVLKALVGDKTLSDSDEKYGLSWHGKRRARQLALTPSSGTLRPCPEESVDWETTQNLMIEGDNLEVLKLLQKSYAGKVKLIYIDPPYNTGKDFVYPDNFQDNIKNYLEMTGQVEGGQKISSNTEASGRFHTDWLNMMYPRLKLARNLLKEDGVIFISIDDNEALNLRKIGDEIFGETCFVADLTVVNNLKGRNDKSYIATANERMLMYVKSEAFNEYGLDLPIETENEYQYEDELGRYRLIELRKRGGADTRQDRPKMYYSFYVNPETGAVSLEKTKQCSAEALPVKSNGVDGRWRWSSDTANKNINLLVGRLVTSGEKYNIYEKDYLEQNGEQRRIKPKSVMSGSNYSTDVATKNYRALMPDADFTNPKPVAFLEDLICYATSPTEEAVILDFFAGCGTTGHATLSRNAKDDGNRRYILVQLPEPTDIKNYKTIADITKERLRRASMNVKSEYPLFTGDTGFRVFKLDQSNIRSWIPNPENLKVTLLDNQDHLLEGRTEADVLYELLLKLGLDLCVPIEDRTIAGKSVSSVGGGVLMACLAEQIPNNKVEALAQGIVDWHKELAPAGDTTCVFRDSAFADDVAKTNMAAILEQHGIQNVRSL